MKLCKTPGCLTAGQENFYKHPEMGDGYLSYCKACVKERLRHQRRTDPKVRERDRLRYRSNPERQAQLKALSKTATQAERRARNAVSNAIRAGKLTRPDTCGACSKPGFIEAAHIDYSRPLDIRWLCRSCHRRWDSKEPKH